MHRVITGVTDGDRTSGSAASQAELPPAGTAVASLVDSFDGTYACNGVEVPLEALRERRSVSELNETRQIVLEQAMLAPGRFDRFVDEGWFIIEDSPALLTVMREIPEGDPERDPGTQSDFNMLRI